MLTYTGKQVDPKAPIAEMIDVRDIAHAQSQIPRFVGQLKKKHPLAVHSVFVSRIIQMYLSSSRRYLKLDKEVRTDILPKVGLFHDAHEAYTGDIPSPIKALLKPAISYVEESLDQAIFKHVGLPTDLNDSERRIVKWADKLCYILESEELRKVTPCEEERNECYDLAEEIFKGDRQQVIWSCNVILGLLRPELDWTTQEEANIMFLERYIELMKPNG